VGLPLGLLVGMALWVFGACDGDGGDGQGGAGQGSGGCYAGTPVALFTVNIRAADGPLPVDTTLTVTWSAGAEPVFALNDKNSWKTLDQGSNVECAVDHSGPVPTDLDQLRCELWTSGVTEIEVVASGYETQQQTLQPKELDDCVEPVPSDIDVELVRDQDAGAR